TVVTGRVPDVRSNLSEETHMVARDATDSAPRAHERHARQLGVALLERRTVARPDAVEFSVGHTISACVVEVIANEKPAVLSHAKSSAAGISGCQSPVELAAEDLHFAVSQRTGHRGEGNNRHDPMAEKTEL